MNNKSYKISIITICFNEEEDIKETIESVISQTYTNKEYIVIDGGSKDNTLKIVKNYYKNINILISEKDKGIYDAMNKGISIATGDWILFVNGGDRLFSNDVLERVFNKYINSYSSVIYGDIVLKKPDNKLEVIKKKEYPLFNIPNMPSGHGSCLVKSEYLKFLYFNAKYKISGDIDFFKRLYTINNNYQYVNVPISIFKSHGGVSTQYTYSYFKEYYYATSTKNHMTLIKLKALFHFTYNRTKHIFERILHNRFIM